MVLRRRTMRISKLTVFIILILILGSAGAFAQAAQLSDTGSLILTGSVAKRVFITITGVGNYDSLDLMTDVSDLEIATVNEKSNVKAGYTVKLSSANGSKFATGGSTDVLDYSLSYDGAAVTFAGSEAVITDANDRTGSTASGVNKSLAISYAGTAVNIYDGVYSDTLTFTIEAK
jgi:hypothetical protein